MTSNVKSLFGGRTWQPQPNENAIAALSELLEMAYSGEIVGVVVAGLCRDGCGLYRIGGQVGGYSLLGAVDVAKDELMDIVRGET